MERKSQILKPMGERRKSLFFLVFLEMLEGTGGAVEEEDAAVDAEEEEEEIPENHHQEEMEAVEGKTFNLW